MVDYKDEILEVLLDYLPKDICKIIRSYTYKSLPLSLQYDIKNYRRPIIVAQSYNVLRIESGCMGPTYYTY